MFNANDDFVEADFPWSDDETIAVEHQQNNMKEHNKDLLLVEGANSEESVHYSRTVKRKFPGPAGILPEMERIQSDKQARSDEHDSNFNDSKVTQDIENASSQCIPLFETCAWHCAQRDVEHSGFPGIQTCNIAHLKRLAFSKTSKALKYAFLVLAVSNMETGQDLFISLRDPTGEIQGHINSELLDQFLELRRGCVLVLKNVGVLKSRQTRGLYLLITCKNLAVIYPSESRMSKLAMLKAACEDIDFTSGLDTSFDTFNLDLSRNETPPRRPMASTSSGNRPTLDLMKKNQFSAPRASTSHRDTLKSPFVRPKISQITYDVTSESSRLGKSTSLESPQSIEKKYYKSCNQVQNSGKPLERSFTVLSQNIGDSEEDLNATISSLLEGINTDSFFEDF